MRDILKRVSNLLFLPPEAVAGVFRLELIGAEELYLENHKGILEYSDTEVVLHGGDRILRICGKHLSLCTMTDSEVLLRGEFEQISFAAV
ncbi:MAG: YabP/YqfC family sporulation protein [Oscillospiraceae bacterium]|nr:YabP/YqfC family sporulation protein [Oscillospiraceae bacterium]